MTIDDYDNIWIGTIYDNGLKKFDGTNWTDYDTSNSGILSNGLTFIEIDEYGNKWIGHRFEGLSVFNEGGVVSVEEESTTKKLLPENFTLYQNYPNPFNPSTTISYSIPKRSNVTLKVFDVLGSEVATLVKEEQPQGNYEIDFD